MKKLFITLALAAATFVGANAQFVIGGHLSLGSNFAGVSYDGDDQLDNSNLGFGLGAKFAYAFKEKFEIGLKAGFDYDYTSVKTYLPGGSATATGDGFGWYITPTFRWSFLNVDRFHLGLQADLSFFGDDGAALFEAAATPIKSFGVGLSAKPFIAFDITDHLIIDAELNVVGFGFNVITNTEETSPMADDAGKLTVVNIGENINSNAGRATMNLVTLGIAYKF